MDEKRSVGKPRKYKNESEVIEVINRYFEEIPFEQYSVTGLALLFGSKQLLQDYERRPEYTDILRQAKLYIENSYEMSLRANGRAGDIFALKNFGWTDKQELEHSGQITSELKATDDQIDRVIEALKPNEP